MIRVGRPWNLLLLLVGPGPISLMHSPRSNKSSSEGDTFPRLVRRRVAAANHGEFFLALVPPLLPPLVGSCLQLWPRLGVLLLPSAHVFFCADSGLPTWALVCLGTFAGWVSPGSAPGFTSFLGLPGPFLVAATWSGSSAASSFVSLATALPPLLAGSPR
jgi:hypothetical protein